MAKFSILVSWACAVMAYASSRWWHDYAPTEWGYLSLMWLNIYFINKESGQ